MNLRLKIVTEKISEAKGINSGTARDSSAIWISHWMRKVIVLFGNLIRSKENRRTIKNFKLSSFPITLGEVIDFYTPKNYDLYIETIKKVYLYEMRNLGKGDEASLVLELYK